MTSAFRQAMDIAFELRDVAVQDRDQALSEACGDDTELANEVRSILDASAIPDDAFDQPLALTLMAEISAGDIPDIPGYEIAEELGRGGMGVVYRAFDLANARRVVALKVMPPLRNDREKARYSDETAAMARLLHPNIAVLYQSGVHDSRPFVAMEYVDGVRLDRYCDNRKLKIPERLALVEQICVAIGHAHEHGILHQDIKPANILVTEDSSGHPKVKVIDFGIASLLQGEARAPSGQSSLGSPAYVSPERAADPVGFRADMREDVYAIGVVLFELLCGRRPNDAELSDDDADKVAAARGVSRRGLAAALSGELQSIVDKALKRDRAQRYRSPVDLGSDLHALAQNQPVTAHSTSLFYVARKFAVRRRGLVLGVAVALGSLIYGFVASNIEAHRSELARAEAEQVTQFVTHLFAAAEPSVENPRQIDAIDLLEQGLANAEGDLESQPAVLGRVLQVIGMSYAQLGELEQAGELLERSIELRMSPAQGRSTESMADSWLELADVRRKLADFDGATEALDRAETLYLGLDPPSHEGQADTFNSRANLLFARADYKGAENLHRQALKLREQVLGAEALATGVSANNVAAMLLMQRDPAAAEPYLRRALISFEQQLPTGHAWIDIARTNLADSLGKQRRPDEAITTLQPVLSGQLHRLGDAHPDLIPTLSNFVDFYRDSARYEQAEATAQQALTVAMHVYEPPHPGIARTQSKLASVAFARWHLDEADRHYQASLAMYQEVYGPDHRLVALQQQRIGRLLLRQNRPADALTWLDQALQFNVDNFGSEHYLTLSVDRDRLAALVALGQASETLAQQLKDRHQGVERIRPRDWFVLDYLLARTLWQQDPERAAELLNTQLNLSDPDVPDWERAQAWALLAHCKQRVGDAAAAASAARQATGLLDESLSGHAALGKELAKLLYK